MKKVMTVLLSLVLLLSVVFAEDADTNTVTLPEVYEVSEDGSELTVTLLLDAEKSWNIDYVFTQDDVIESSTGSADENGVQTATFVVADPNFTGLVTLTVFAHSEGSLQEMDQFEIFVENSTMQVVNYIEPWFTLDEDENTLSIHLPLMNTEVLHWTYEALDPAAVSKVEESLIDLDEAADMNVDITGYWNAAFELSAVGEQDTSIVFRCMQDDETAPIEEHIIELTFNEAGIAMITYAE